MDRIRVDHVITRLILGGAQENTVLTCEGLHADPAFDVRLITGPALGPEGELLERAKRGGYAVEVVGALRRSINPFRDAISFWRLWRLFRKRKPHVVHTHSSKAGILGRLAARLAGVPLIVHTIHGLPFHAYQSRIERMVYRGLEEWCGGLAHRLVCVGEVMKEKAVAAHLAPPDRIDVVYSGMEVDLYRDGPSEVRAKLGVADGDIVVGVVSRLAPLKGHADLIEAIAPLQQANPRIRLLFVGDGELRKELETACEGRAVFTGLVAPEHIPDLLRAMDILVHPSRREGLPRAAVQALLCGRPVIAVDCDGAREVVVTGETGTLVAPGDREALRDALERMIARPDRGRSLGAEGRRRFLDRFDHRAMVKALSAIYRPVIAP